MADSDYSETLDDLLESAQPNPLLHRVDGLAATRDWEGLVTLADRCRQAVERGKQLWPIAEHIEYRLALEAPASYAGSVLHPEAGKFALGPLTEVAASTHTFEELEPHMVGPQTRGMVAAERVVRGEDLADRSVDRVLETPLRSYDWEPGYSLATYKASEAEFPSPEISWARSELPSGRGSAEVLDEPDVTRALMDLAQPWMSQSKGTVDAVVVEGSAEAAAVSLSSGAGWIGLITAQDAVSAMAWAAASGGAYGRRRGAAVGRSLAWSALALLTDLEWPPDPEQLGEEVDRLTWYAWEPQEAPGGWSLYLAVEDPEDGWAAAIAAADQT